MQRHLAVPHRGVKPDGSNRPARAARTTAVRDRCCVTNLITVTTFLSRREHAAVNTAVRKQILGDHRPALTVIATGIRDPARLVEIEAVAAA